MSSLLGLLNIFNARKRRKRSSFLARKKGSRDKKPLSAEFVAVGERSDGHYRIGSRCGVQKKVKGKWKNISLKSVARDHRSIVRHARSKCRPKAAKAPRSAVKRIRVQPRVTLAPKRRR